MDSWQNWDDLWFWTSMVDGTNSFTQENNSERRRNPDNSTAVLPLGDDPTEPQKMSIFSIPLWIVATSYEKLFFWGVIWSSWSHQIHRIRWISAEVPPHGTLGWPRSEGADADRHQNWNSRDSWWSWQSLSEHCTSAQIARHFFLKLETCGDMGQAGDNLFENYHRTKRGTCIARLPKGDIIHYDKI